MLAIAILVANGVLLFVILRFLLWLAFPGNRDEAETFVAARPATAAALAGPADAGEAAPVAAMATVPLAAEPAASPPGPGMSVLAPTPVGRPRAYPHRLLIGLPVILALFAGGVWLGSVVGGSGSAAAATHTIHVKGRVITVNHRTEVRVPAQTVVVKKGSIISVPATTVRLPAHVVTHIVKRTFTTVLPGTTHTVVTTVAFPTTVTDTSPAVTVTETATETVTATDTGTTSTSATT